MSRSHLIGSRPFISLGTRMTETQELKRQIALRQEFLLLVPQARALRVSDLVLTRDHTEKGCALTYTLEERGGQMSLDLRSEIARMPRGQRDAFELDVAGVLDGMAQVETRLLLAASPSWDRNALAAATPSAAEARNLRAKFGRRKTTFVLPGIAKALLVTMPRSPAVLPEGVDCTLSGVVDRLEQNRATICAIRIESCPPQAQPLLLPSRISVRRDPGTRSSSDVRWLRALDDHRLRVRMNVVVAFSWVTGLPQQLSLIDLVDLYKG